MKIDKNEAVAIGRLTRNGGKTIGWVYRWNTTEISILWLSDTLDPIPISFAPQPGCDHATRDEVVGLLRALRADGDKD